MGGSTWKGDNGVVTVVEDKEEDVEEEGDGVAGDEKKVRSSEVAKRQVENLCS